MKGSTAAGYAERFDRVFAHIDEHLSEELSVERLSRVAHFSKYHFHRQFSQFAGIGVARYIQLMRLRRASYRLAFESETSILDIALEARFENPESFSRAFKKTFGQTPSRFRRAADWRPWTGPIDYPDENEGTTWTSPSSTSRIPEWRCSNTAATPR